MPRRSSAAAAVLVLLAACSSGGGEAADDDPLAPVATTGAPAPSAPPGSAFGRPSLLGNLQDRDVTESSGLAASRRFPGHYWTHNDSGDGPFVYCTDDKGGTCGVWQLPGAEAFDWEDMAAGPGPDPAQHYLYLGDIGDNLADRTEVVVYRVPEPAISPATARATKAAPRTTEAADVIRLRYPDGPHNAEGLMVHPQSGDLYIATKETGPGVYVARAPLSTSGPNRLEKVATLSISGGDRFSVVTGGDISPDGRRVALCTYVEGYELTLPPGAAFDLVWAQPPQPIALGLRTIGEAIAYRLDGNAVLATSESVGGGPTPLYQAERT